MSITLAMSLGSVKLTNRGAFASAETACPHCSEPLRVLGRNRRIGADDRSYLADGHCVACEAGVGLITAKVETLFGLREDNAVLLHGRARVY